MSEAVDTLIHFDSENPQKSLWIKEGLPPMEHNVLQVIPLEPYTFKLDTVEIRDATGVKTDVLSNKKVVLAHGMYDQSDNTLRFSNGQAVRELVLKAGAGL